MAGKRLELLKQTIPQAARVAIVSRPPSQSGPVASHVKETELAARALNIKLNSIEVRGREDSESAFRIAREQQAGALIVVAAAGMAADREKILELVAKTKMPVMYTNPDWVIAGGLMSYAADLQALARRRRIH